MNSIFIYNAGLNAIYNNDYAVLNYIKNKLANDNVIKFFDEAVKINNLQMMEYLYNHYKRILQKDNCLLTNCVSYAIYNNNIEVLKWLNTKFDLRESRSQFHFAYAADNKYYDICYWLFKNAFPLPANIRCKGMQDKNVKEIISEKNWWFIF